MHRLILPCVLILILVSQLPAQEPYGSGTAGSSNVVPQISAPQAWMGNSTFGISVSQGLGGGLGVIGISTAPGSTFLGATEVLIGLAPAELLILDMLQLGGASGVPGAGSATYPLPLSFAPIPSFAGTDFFAQVVIPDGSLFAATRGLKVEITMPPLVFVGTSVGGNADPYYLCDPFTLTLANTGTLTYTNNVTDAVFVNGGRDLFVGRSLGNAVDHADLSSLPPTWSSFYVSAAAGCYGLAADEENQILYTLTDPGTATREIVALDMNPQSPTYGQVIGSTLNAFGGTNLIERWAQSPDKKTICVLAVFSPTMYIVDTDVSSPTYLQLIGSVPVPVSTPSALSFNTQVLITPDNQTALVLIQTAGQTPGEIARYHFATQSFLDHDGGTLGIQNIGLASNPVASLGSAPTDIAITKDGTTCITCGFGGTGWIGRLDLDPANPATWSYTSLNPGPSLVGSWACGIAPDGLTAAVGTFPNSQLVVFDPSSGSLVGTVPLPGASNVYTVEYR